MERTEGDGPPAATTAWQVGDLLVDAARAQVWRDGTEVPLPKLSFDLLLALIEAAPRILSLDELMDRVWAGVVVSPETVSQRAKLLRDALGDDIRAPRYVVAVRGRGYRLVAPVTRPEIAAPPRGDTPPALQVAPPAPASPRPRWRWLALPGLVVLVLATAWLVMSRQDQRPASTAPSGTRQAMPERSVAVLPFESPTHTKEADVLAFGLAEAVLHQLANLSGLVVIARTSSFALGPEPGDAREIGRRLNARYLLEGSVQQEAGQLRVTAQLIDSATGMHVWSLRFDKPRADIFAVQDEIAAQVARALQLSVDAGGAARVAGRGTSNFSAYLAYLGGRALLASGRVVDVGPAIEQFDRALQLDPAFAAAYVSLAEAQVFEAEFDPSEDREERFAAAIARAQGSIEKALALDPQFGPAYLVRGYCEAFSDLARAEASYRRGLELRPNDARGYAGLAAVLFEQPAKREEALRMLERARRIDPLEPAHDVTQAVFVLYDRGDVRGADALLRNVLQRDPQYLPALARLGELDWCCRADASEAIELLERAIALDPRAQWQRRALLRAYLDVGDLAAAESVAGQSPAPRDALQLALLVRRGDWLHAGEVAYAVLSQGQAVPIDEPVITIAIRRHARLTGQFAKAIEALETLAEVTWLPDGSPLVPSRPGLRLASLGVVDLLQASGSAARAQRLLDAVLARMREELRADQREETWYFHGMSVATALRGESAPALDWLRRGVEAGPLAHEDWLALTVDPAFDKLRTTDGYAALERRVREHVRSERVELDALRKAGRVPKRS